MNALQVKTIRDTLHAAGYDDAFIDQHIADAERDEAKLVARTCPTCDAPNMECKQDPRSDGPCIVAGPWFNFKCRACGYFCDAKLPPPPVAS